MRIALYVHCFFPAHFYGTEAYTLSLAKELVALGHEPIVVSATLAGEPRQNRFIEEYSYDSLRVVSIDKNFYPDRRVRDTYEQPTLRHVHERILRKIQPDIVHICHLISHTTALLEVAHRMGIPTFATLTDFFGLCYNNQLENTEGELCNGPDALRSNCIACFLKLEGSRPDAKAITRLANLQVFRDVVSYGLAHLGQGDHSTFAISGFAPNDIVSRPGILRQAMSVFREAIAPTQFLKQAYERNAFPVRIRISRFGIAIDRAPKPPRTDKKNIRLGFIGQIAPHKGLHVLVDAVRRCGRDNINLKVWGALDQVPTYAERLRAQAQGLPISFHGTIPRSELALALASIDFLVIPSTWYENSPLILLQALATHTPPIISDVQGMTEFVGHGRNGFHFERGNVDSLVRVLRSVADDPELADRLSAATIYDRIPADMARDVADMYADHELPWTEEPKRTHVAVPASDDPSDRGIEGVLPQWLHFNEVTAFESAENLTHVAPFAPMPLIHDTTGLQRIEDFAKHGADIVRALAATTDRPLVSFRSWLDLGVGVGRLARMFKGFTGRYVGVDVDLRAIGWLRANLPWVQAIRTLPRVRLPFPVAHFDMIVSISLFTHLNEADQAFYLAELHRVAQPGSTVVITVHGDKALDRAMSEGPVLEILGVSVSDLHRARAALSVGSGFYFVRQGGHLTTEDYEYGVAFMNRGWIDAVWSKWYDIVKIIPGGIHDFQDVIVLHRR